jgi:hypothetical protein
MVRRSGSLRIIALVVAVLGLCTGLLAIHLWHPFSQPLREGPLISYPIAEFSSAARQSFLTGNFKVIKHVKELPEPVQRVFTEDGGSRSLMADPGKEFLAGDVIYDASVPRKRLILAGTLDDKCFVNYEQGGYAHTYIVVFFRIASKGIIQPLWRGYCGPALSIEDLRSQVFKDECAHPVQHPN